METNARFLTIGLFTLAVILAGFGFVFWLERTGGLAQRETVLVRFENTVSGLQPGAAVMFDGLRVGEVSSLQLDTADPTHVLASLAIAAGTPLRRDTKVGLEFQGLMGTAAVSLEGGSPTAPRLLAQNGKAPLLTADPEAGRSLTETARGALKHVDGILTDNAGPLKDTIGNLKAFSGALARNSDKIDGLLSGLQKMTGTGPAAPPIPIYDLAVPKLSAGAAPRSGQLAVTEPSAVVALQTQRLLTRTADGLLIPTGTMEWSDSLPKLIQAKLLQSFTDAGIAATESPLAAPGPDDRQLQIDLRRFGLSSGPDAAAEIVIAAKILSGDGHVLRSRTFEVAGPAATPGDSAAVRALNDAFATTVQQLAAWLGGQS